MLWSPGRGCALPKFHGSTFEQYMYTRFGVLELFAENEVHDSTNAECSFIDLCFFHLNWFPRVCWGRKLIFHMRRFYIHFSALFIHWLVWWFHPFFIKISRKTSTLHKGVRYVFFPRNIKDLIYSVLKIGMLHETVSLLSLAARNNSGCTSRSAHRSSSKVSFSLIDVGLSSERGRGRHVKKMWQFLVTDSGMLALFEYILFE